MIDASVIDAVSKWDLSMWEAVLAFGATAIPVLLGVSKIKSMSNPWLAKGRTYLKTREKAKLSKLFKEMEPMIKAHLQIQISSTLEQYNAALRDHQITLHSSVAESVEFKTFVNDSILNVQSSIEELMVVVKQNAKEAKLIMDCLSQGEGSCTLRGKQHAGQ